MMKTDLASVFFHFFLCFWYKNTIKIKLFLCNVHIFWMYTVFLYGFFRIIQNYLKTNSAISAHLSLLHGQYFASFFAILSFFRLLYTAPLIFSFHPFPWKKKNPLSDFGKQVFDDVFLLYYYSTDYKIIKISFWNYGWAQGFCRLLPRIFHSWNDLQEW